MSREVNSRRLEPRYSGPYLVISRLSWNDYIIQEICNYDNRRKVNVKYQKLYYDRDQIIGPELPSHLSDLYYGEDIDLHDLLKTFTDEADASG